MEPGQASGITPIYHSSFHFLFHNPHPLLKSRERHLVQQPELRARGKGSGDAPRGGHGHDGPGERGGEPQDRDLNTLVGLGFRVGEPRMLGLGCLRALGFSVYGL